MEIPDHWLIDTTAPSQPRPDSASVENHPLVLLGALTGVTAWLAWRISIGVRSAVLFDGGPWDGPFQLLNPLRRLAAGQIPFHDFPVFHGVAIPLLHYPLFVLLGGGLYGSELARQLVSTLAFFGTIAAILRRIAGSWRRATVWLALSLLLLGAAGRFVGKYGDPQNSLVGLRGLAPLMGVCIYATVERRWLRVALLALCLGLAPLLGVDQAPAVFMALGAVAAVLAVRVLLGRASNSLALLAEIASAAALGLALAGVLLLTICGPAGAIAALRFYFCDVSGDQFWYYGVPPNDYFKSLRDSLVGEGGYSGWILVLSAAVAGSLIYLSRARAVSYRQVGAALLLCYAGLSATPLLGYLSTHYLHPGTLALLLAAVLVYGGWVSKLLFRYRMPLVAALAAFTVLKGAAAAQNLSMLLHAQHRSAVQFSDRWQRMLSDGADVLNRYHSRGKRPLWSLFSGELESRRGDFLPVEDYIIHALGPERRVRYLAAFREAEPAVVVTIDPPRFIYEQWLQNETWGVYEELLERYSVVRTSEWAVFWVRSERGAAVVPRSVGRANVPDGQQVAIEPPPGGTQPRLGTVTVTYRIEYSSPVARFFSKAARYLLTCDSRSRTTPVSLPPFAHTWKFPVIAQGAPVRFTASTTGILGGGQVRITGATVEWWPVDVPLSLFDDLAARK